MPHASAAFLHPSGPCELARKGVWRCKKRQCRIDPRIALGSRGTCRAPTRQIPPPPLTVPPSPPPLHPKMCHLLRHLQCHRLRYYGSSPKSCDQPLRSISHAGGIFRGHLQVRMLDPGRRAFAGGMHFCPPESLPPHCTSVQGIRPLPGGRFNTPPESVSGGRH